jgi:hypothetical protein
MTSVNLLPAGFYAVDTETTRFDEEEYISINGKRKSRVTPHTTGARLILGSVAGHHPRVFYKQDMCDFVASLLKGGATLIFHNAAFDIHVLIEADPTLKPLFVQALREHRIRDTMILEQLIKVAKGVPHHILTADNSLKILAKKYANIHLDKGSVRLQFDRFEHRPPDPVKDKEALDYALRDAEATYLVYASQSRQAKVLTEQPDCRYPALSDAQARFGVLAERNHVMGSVALFWLQRFPVRIDAKLVEKARIRVERESARLVLAMSSWTTTLPKKYKRKSGDVIKQVETPWAKEAKDGTIKLSYKALQKELGEYAEQHGIVPELTPTGTIGLKRDFWSEHIPRATDLQRAEPERAQEPVARLSLWLEYLRLRLMHSRYLDPLAQSERHYPNYYSIGARTTRTSANKFPVQQTPKRRDGIRGLFVPEDGNVFIEADYKAAELTALAQVYHLMFGGSRLGDSIRQGGDPHEETAKRIWSDYDEQPTKQQENLRQAAKAVNFGLPGGMGPAKFALFARGYGLYLTDEEARHLRLQALNADPELQRYLFDSASAEGRVRKAAENLGVSCDELVSCLNAWRDTATGAVHWRAALKRLIRWSRDPAGCAHYSISCRPGFEPKYDLWKGASRTLSGAIRGRASFTEGHNFPFQAAVADVGKIALFNLWSEWTNESSWSPVNFIHDSIMIQTLDQTWHCSYASALLERCMKSALDEVCPDINGGVDIGDPKPRWGPLGGIFRDLT